MSGNPALQLSKRHAALTRLLSSLPFPLSGINTHIFVPAHLLSTYFFLLIHLFDYIYVSMQNFYEDIPYSHFRIY